MQVRQATVSDIPEMLRNTRSFVAATPYAEFGVDDESMTLAFHAMMEDGLCFVIDGENGHLGGIGAIKGPLFFNQKVMVANERFWFVLPDKRASGVGRALIAAFMAACKKQGCQLVAMVCLEDSVGEIYRALGFEKAESLFIKRL